MAKDHNKFTLTVPELAEIMGRSEQYIRLAMERGEINAGSCRDNGKGKRNSYLISKKLVEDFLGDITDRLNEIRNR